MILTSKYNNGGRADVFPLREFRMPGQRSTSASNQIGRQLLQRLLARRAIGKRASPQGPAVARAVELRHLLNKTGGVVELNEVSHFGYAGGRPGRALGFFTLRPRMHTTDKSHGSLVDLHFDKARVQDGAPLESSLDLGLDCRGRVDRSHIDLIRNPLYSNQATY